MNHDEDAKKEIERIQDICYNLLNEYALKLKASGVGASCQSSASSFTSSDETDPMSNYDKFIAFDSDDSYLEERVIPRKDVLVISISIVASESTFSTCGRFISPHRSRLHHDTLEALMCSQDWLWAEAKEIGATPSECCTLRDDVETN
ncbi:hypothetical protein ACS0TY_002565 [Phlomoides rotata]